MNVPAKTNPRWAEIVTGKKNYPLKFLAAKIMLSRIMRTTGANPTQKNISTSVNELYGLYNANINVPSAQADIQTIFSGMTECRQELLDISSVSQLITEGKVLLIAGEENLLAQLPKGNWIGGSTPYFITPTKGCTQSQDKVFVTDLSVVARDFTITTYSEANIGSVYNDAGCNGFSIIIIPAASKTHESFSVNAPNYNNFGSQPLIGWIAGIHLNDLDSKKPAVFNGETGQSITDDAIIMHVDLIAGKTVDVGVINLFEQGDGDTLTFDKGGFECLNVNVNGIRENFCEYLTRNNIDTRLPLVADYYGTMVNISFQSLKAEEPVKLYAPVFSGIRYKIAKPVKNYPKEFSKHLATSGLKGQKILFSCNCILNYLYSDLEGNKTEQFVGPVTFGEIAYQLLNQTLVYLQLNDA